MKSVTLSHLKKRILIKMIVFKVERFRYAYAKVRETKRATLLNNLKFNVALETLFCLIQRAKMEVYIAMLKRIEFCICSVVHN